MTVAPNDVAGPDNHSSDSMKPLNEVEAFANCFMPMLRKFTSPASMKTDLMMDLNILIGNISKRAVKSK